MDSLVAQGRARGREASIAAMALSFAASSIAAQAQPRSIAQVARQVQRDSVRAAQLYVSNRPSDHPQPDFSEQREMRERVESIYAFRAAGIMNFKKVFYRSSADSLEIPAYLFSPLINRGRAGHAAIVWVHGGVHSMWTETWFPFVREAILRGYVVIAPDFRGSTGYDSTFYNAVDYGGYELDDVATAVAHLKTLGYVDAERIGILGWSHGGFIAAMLAFRENTPFKAAVALAPVVSLVHRLSAKGPDYQRQFATQERFRALPFENPQLYYERSPLYNVDRLTIPFSLHVPTNDGDVEFQEAELLVNALRVKKSALSEIVVYRDPPGGHAFNLLVNRSRLERKDSPEQRDSWNRIWTFFEWWLQPHAPN